MIKVLVVCGTGGITSSVAEKEIQEEAKRNGISITTSRCTPLEVNSRARDVDLIVSTTVLNDDYGVPIINGLPLITKIGKDKVLLEIMDFLKKIDKGV
ncbi:PTS sugar transporter subunit IIB [Tepidimicrobium xylanilyticum]|uniref:PTS system, galactitol-specific IIB component n=1 Tax=Tepidimicrobium xylanilyticum TaxID=1123352 RepID=A0A1H3FD22_9FIRM|nr:PTS sugar transporter subunit IIB [Tepidimicrobium xylanilyticum]SDX88902.1 PTS system, galactitol-specific IIB component [Tepidimicrobium xylanilyticum]